MPASYAAVSGLGHLHCDILIFTLQALFLLNQCATCPRCYYTTLEEQCEYSGENVFCELEEEV